MTYKNFAFLGIGFALGYAKALSDSEELLTKLDDILETVIESAAVEDPEAAAERKAKEEAVDSTAVEVVPEIERETPKEASVQ
jgi:dTDP-4-dehydrorhamnose reductase